MSQFSYAQYQNVVAQAQANGEGTKIGYFKLKDDGDIAIARINIGSTDDMMFASVHTLNVGGKWLKVSCLNPLGSSNGTCGLCAAHAANPKGSVSKSAKKLFIPMIVSYRDPNATTGYTTPIPVIWDRPAAFSRELASKLMAVGDLRNTLILITRNGKANDMQTTYSVDILPESHPVFKPDMIPNDFNAFNNFNIARHSYWEKSAEEINSYLATGQFPERTATNSQTMANGTVAASAGTNVYSSTTIPNNVPSTATVPVQTVATNNFNSGAAVNIPTNETPVRNFSGFSF